MAYGSVVGQANTGVSLGAKQDQHEAKEIPTSLAILSGELDALDEVATGLRAKLSAVLHPEPPAERDNVQTMGSAGTPLGQALSEVVARISRARLVLMSLNDRLGL